MIKIKISEQVQKHLSSHFQQDQIGSQFTIGSLEEILFDAMHQFPKKFKEAKPDKDGRIRLSFHFPHTIGYTNVIHVEKLTDDERDAIVIKDRDGIPVRIVLSARRIPATELQLILSANNHLITMFPGEMAPPLPASPEIHDDYWDHHVFIEPIES